MEFWRWFLAIGGGITFLSSVLYALTNLVKYLKHGKKNADMSFERKVQKITNEIVNEKIEKLLKSREQEFQLIRDFIKTELKPINENINNIKILTQHLEHSLLTDLKIKLRAMYHETFEIHGELSKIEKSNWDKWFSDYSILGGNSDIKVMNDHIQKVHLEMTIEKQKERAKMGKNKNNKKEVEQT